MTQLDLDALSIDDAEADQEIALLDSLKAHPVIQKAVEQTKQTILKHPPPPPEQDTFSFIPTTLARISPFFPLSKRDRDQYLPPDGMVWDNSWGTITMKGPKLSIYDETVLLACLVLMIKNRTKETFDTTRYELCKVMDITPASENYKSIWASLSRLNGAQIILEVWEPGSGKKKKKAAQMVNTILSGARIHEETNRLSITINPYFLEMYAANLVTGINLQLRSKLKGDTTKALYRFLRAQKGTSYTCHLLTLCKAINLDTDKDMSTLRKQIRKALTELKRQKYLSRSLVNKHDIVSIWKFQK